MGLLPISDNSTMTSVPKFGPSLDPGQCSDPGVVVVSSCNYQKLFSIFRSFDSQKASIVRDIGFGGLLHLPLHHSLNEHLSLWLYKNYDFANNVLRLAGGVELKFADVDAHLIIGLPFDGQEVESNMSYSEDILTAFKKILANDSTSDCLTVPFLESILTRSYESGWSDAQKDAFKIAVVLYSVIYFLAPEQSDEFPTEIIQNFLAGVKLAHFNWAQFVLRRLSRACMYAQAELNDGNNNIVLMGCSLLLQVFYLDNLNFGPSSPYHIMFPRAQVFMPATLAELTELDFTGLSDGKLMQFGKTEVRASIDVCYSRCWEEYVILDTEHDLTAKVNLLSSIEKLSRCLELFDQFPRQLNHFNVTGQTSAHDLLLATKVSYETFGSKMKEIIQTLSSKTARLAKACIIKKYSRNAPVSDDLAPQKRKNIGTSSSTPSKRPNLAGDHAQQQNPNRNMVVFERKIITSHSNFPTCFVQLFTHANAPRQIKAKFYKWITDDSLSRDELNRDWIVFNGPISLSISGNVVQKCLRVNGSFDVSLIDAIMVLWNHLDAKLYNHVPCDAVTQRRWRHFLPASFAETVLQQPDYLNSTLIRSCLIGDHITYSIQHCQQFIMPVNVSGSWSCYFWDFKTKTVTVLDPMLMDSYSSKVSGKHSLFVSQLHNALLNCKNHFFSGWDIDEVGWQGLYTTHLDRACKIQNSGVYSVYYARCFDGQKLQTLVHGSKKANLSEARGGILHHLFTCEHNRGHKPSNLIELLGRAVSSSEYNVAAT